MKTKRSLVYLAVLVIWLLMGAGCSFSTANVTNAQMTTGVDENYYPVDKVSEFSVGNEPYMTAELHNAPDDTLITVVWYYEGEELDRISFDNQEMTDTMIMSHMPAEMAAQAGSYSVEIYIDEREKPDATVEFTME